MVAGFVRMYNTRLIHMLLKNKHSLIEGVYTLAEFFLKNRLKSAVIPVHTIMSQMPLPMVMVAIGNSIST